MIEINETFFIQLINFFIMVFFLNQFLFKPVLELVERRNKKLKSLSEDTARFNEKAEKAIAEYDEKFAEMKKKSGSIVHGARVEALKEQENLLKQARTAFSEKVEATKVEIAKEVQSAGENLKKEVQGLSGLITSKLLGRKVG